MKRKLHTSEQIFKKRGQADALIASGGTIEQACRKLGISDATYYNWRKLLPLRLRLSSSNTQLIWWITL